MISIELSSNAVEVLRQVREFPPRMATAIAHAMDLENELTVGHIQATRMSMKGPFTLGVVTNRLRSSIWPSPAIVAGTTITAAIGSNVRYAAAHEYGFDGNVTVRSFTRHNPRGDQSTAAAEMNPKTGRIRKVKPRLTAAGISTVRAFTRHMYMPARSFIRKGIEERVANYSASISAAILGAWEGSSQ